MITRIGLDDLETVWPMASKLLEPSLNGAHPEVVRGYIESGTYQLWMADDKAACTTAINTFPIGKILTVVHLGGRGMEEWLFDGLGAIEHWGRENKCDRIRINGRDEWSRVLPGYRRASVVSEKVL